MYSFGNEFFVYDPDFKGEHGDFTDNTVFSPEERQEYLEKYADFLKINHKLAEASEYVVPMEKAVEVCREIDSVDMSKDIVLKEMDAYLCEMDRAYKGWSFYTAKTVCEDGCLVLKNADLPPNPAAMYYFSTKERLKSIKLQFLMDSAFYTELTENVFVCTPGRTVELRNGLADIVKLQFYSNGECYAKLYDVNAYEPKHILIGRFSFDTWNSLEITLGEEVFSVRINEQVKEDIPLVVKDDPDSLFFCGGMFHYGDWLIKPVSAEFKEKVITEFFVPETSPEAKEKEYIGKISLPYAVGGFDKRDKVLVLEGTFKAEKEGRTVLVCDSLDPGGEVYLDGICIAVTDSFECFEVDITKYLAEKEKEHLLQIRVNPRAPEVLYEWHRHKDTYIGWFCEKITLKTYDAVEFSDLQVVTEKIGSMETEHGEHEVEVLFSGSSNRPCMLRIHITQFWNGRSEEKEVCAMAVAEETFAIKAAFRAKVWTPDSPALYAVRFAAYDKQGALMGEEVIETGFRTIEQKNGEIHLNGKRIVLKGALQMQFLPPYKETPVTHVCPRSEQIVWQDMMLKALNGNTMRLHILGYGSNDERYARYADRLGVLLIWITRYIDSVQGTWWGEWKAKEAYKRQIKQRRNHPSIIIWEGANELRLNLKQTDDIHNAFVPAVKSVDNSRLLSPVSHLYYSGNDRRCEYYNDAGAEDQLGNPVTASEYWTDPLVMRSAHPYSLLLGYGQGWHMLRTERYYSTPLNLFGNELPNLYNSVERAYMVSEFAVIGRQDPNTKEAREEYFNPYSYEFPDEKVLGFALGQDRWLVSQAYQALAVQETTKKMMLHDVDGMLWCCLLGGANDGGYLKPIIDNYGYAKLAFYVMKDAFSDVYAITDDVDVKKGKGFIIRPVLFGEKGKKYFVKVNLVNADGYIAAEREYQDICCSQKSIRLQEWRPELTTPGYYNVQFTIVERGKQEG